MIVLVKDASFPNVELGYLRELLPFGQPEDGEKLADVQRDIEAKIIPRLI